MRIVFLAVAALLLSACVVRTAGSVASAGVGLGVGAAKTGVSATGAAIDLATPDGNGAHEDDHHGEDDPRPFDDARNASADVDATLSAARASGKNALIVLGGNWCHDSRGLAAKFENPELAGVIAENYELVWVDVGYRDRNLHVPARFGVPELFGTPTVLILSPAGELLNRDTMHEWRTADSKPYDETLAYFQQFTPTPHQ